MKTAGELILKRLNELKDALKERAIEHKNTICVGRSHGIHAEPTTMGTTSLMNVSLVPGFCVLG